MGVKTWFLSVNICMFTIFFQSFSAPTTPLSQSDNDFFLSSNKSFCESWYSRILDLSLHLWADFDMLQKGYATLLPDHLELVFDASIGKLVHLNWCLDQMLHGKKGPILYEDVCYFIKIMQGVYQSCTAIAGKASLVHRADSTKEVLSGIMSKIDAAFLKQVTAN